MPLMFDRLKVLETSHPLIRILRQIFFKSGITLDDFAAKYAMHGKRLGLSTSLTHNNHGNARKALRRDDEMTFRFFYYILVNVLRLKVKEFRLVIEDDDGNDIVISDKDVVDDQDATAKTLQRLMKG